MIVNFVGDTITSFNRKDKDNNYFKFKATLKKTVPQTLPAIQLLEYFGFVDSDTVELQVENENGERINYNLRPERISRSNVVKVIPDPVPLCYQNGRAYVWDHIDTDNKVYYIQYLQCWSRENPNPGFKGDHSKLPSIKEFQEKIISSIEDNDFDKIIFDIRFNGGGNSAQGTELITALSDIKKLNTKGKLYVIVGRETFSSAIINAMDFQNMTKAILVGEETSGKPNHLGEVRYMQLPSSGLTVQYSTKYFKRTKKDLNTITPDHIIDASFGDFKEGCDPVYNWIVKE